MTPALVDSLCTDIRDGIDQKHAALRAGIGERTFYEWMASGRKNETPETAAFYAAVKKAQADAVAANVMLVQIAAREGTWQAAAWWLERRHPDQYGSDRKRVKELERLLAEIIKGGGGAGTTDPPGKKAPRKAKSA